MKKILVIGSTVADVIVNLDVLPKTAEDVHIKSQSVALGGCAHNVSDMIGHYNVPYDLFSPVGTGIYGDFVRKRLAEKGVTSTAPTPDMANGCCYCFVESSGERTFIVEHGAEYLFKPEWFKGLKTEDYASVYVCGLEIEEKTGDVVVDFLEKSGLPVFFAPGPRLSRIDPSLMDRIFALHPILHLNDDEAREYTAAATIEAAAAILYSRTQAMMKILIPVAAPGIVTTLIFIFINAWNEYTVALCLISTDTLKPLTVGINTFNGYNMIEWQYLFSASIFAIIPVVILFMSIEKNLVSGLASGGVKG